MTYNEYMEQKGVRKGIRKGREEGRIEGDSRARYEIALEFLNLGIDPKNVAKATHLTLVEVNKVKANLGKSREGSTYEN